MPKNVVVLTENAGPSNGLRFVADELKAQGHIVNEFLGKGKGLGTDIENRAAAAILDADFVLFGISSTPATWREEINLANYAKAIGKPYGFFCCNWGEFRRPAFKNVMRGANLLFTVDKADANTAQDYAGVGTNIIPSGNPAWADYFVPKMTREEARAKLSVGPDETLVVVGGSKEAIRNTLLWYHVAQAGMELDDNTVHFVVCPHPGDPSPVGTYDQLFESYASILEKIPAGMNTSKALAGADLFITSISLTGVEAACIGVPTIDFVTEIDEDWWKKLSGSKVWQPIKAGASVEVDTVNDLSLDIEQLLDRGSTRMVAMLYNQNQAFQREKLEGAAKRIVTAILTA